MTIEARLASWRKAGMHINPRRETRRVLGWPSGRQWRKMRKADQREERAIARRARGAS